MNTSSFFEVSFYTYSDSHDSAVVFASSSQDAINKVHANHGCLRVGMYAVPVDESWVVKTYGSQYAEKLKSQ